MTLMMRIIAVFLIGLAAAGAQSPLRAAETGTGIRPVSVREHVIIAGTNVRLGDVFINAGQLSETVIAEAPSVDNPLVLDAYVLSRLAQNFGLDWMPTTVHQRAVIERESDVVDDERIRDLVRDALADRGVTGNDLAIDLGISNRNVKIPADSVLSVESLSYRPGGRRFSAMLVAMTENTVVQRISAAGRVIRMIEVPVAVRRIRRGDVIGPDDLEWVRVHDRSVPARAILDESELVGLTPRRFLRPGVPVLVSDLRRPILVEKNALITMVVATPAMKLTARGRALESGSKGDVIRVANLQSQTVVTGWITDDGKVVVGRRMNDGEHEG